MSLLVLLFCIADQQTSALSENNNVVGNVVATRTHGISWSAEAICKVQCLQALDTP